MCVFTLSLSQYLSNKGLQGISDSKLFNTFFRLCIVLSDSIPSLTFICLNLFSTPIIRAFSQPISQTLTEKVCRDGAKIINDIVRKEEISKDEGERLKPKDCHAPRLSGLPKVHKIGVPLRGVVSTVGSLFEKLSRYLIPVLRTIQGRSGLYVKNSRELKEKVKSWRIDKNEVLVSYDVKNLYPSIPINEALKLVEKLLKVNKTLKNITNLSVGSIMELLKWCLVYLICKYAGQHYILESGPIGLGDTGEMKYSHI